MNDLSFTEMIAEALNAIANGGHTIDHVFGDRDVDPSVRSSQEAHAIGFIEGAAAALDLTALELLEELGRVSAQRSSSGR
ncbi:MAG: hypothetical protein JWO36_7194 [Myxococcales bacterium]|nr:hypothetical protein [Myxococcales bacterium]